MVASFEELLGTPWSHGVNALCWRRELAGDFEEIVRLLTVGEGINTLDEETLRALPVSAAGRVAVETLIEDQRRLREAGLAPVLDCIDGYPRDDDAGPVRTDVYSFHADSAPVAADTWLCSYTEAASEGLRNDEAIKRIEDIDTQAALRADYGGADDEGFREYLTDGHYDLHYAPIPGARPFSFGLGNLWRIAIEYPGCPVPPCLHRAPDTVAGRPPRLLLIS